MGRDAFQRYQKPRSEIFQSTHPHGARPLQSFFLGRCRRISIHAPAWGATNRSAQKKRLTIISIHAPAWGATSASPDLPNEQIDFNPRTRMGRDAGCGTITCAQSTFQSTHPHGARPISSYSLKSFRNFNPRTRMGRDSTACIIFGATNISIHAPAWGATL